VRTARCSARRSVGRWCVVSGAPWRTRRMVSRGSVRVSVRRRESIEDCFWSVRISEFFSRLKFRRRVEGWV